MIVPDSSNALFVDPDDDSSNRDIQVLLDEVGVNYRVVHGSDWRGVDPPWLFFSETGKTICTSRGIKDFVNLLWWNKVVTALEATVGEARGKQWIEEPNELLESRTPLQAYKEGDAKTVFGICLAATEGTYL